MNDKQYKSVLIVNESRDAKITLYIYPTWDFVCWMSFKSKIILPGEKYLHRTKDSYRFRLVARFEDKPTKSLLKLKTWVADKLLKVTEDLRLTEEKLEDFLLEKRVCLRRLQRDKELELTSGKRNLYDILGLDMDQIRQLPIEEQRDAIKKGFHKQIKRWHPDKNFGDEENAKEIIMAREILLDDEMRARYHNKADYDRGWLSLKRFKAIFNPDRFTEEQRKAYKKRMGMFAASLGIAIGGVVLTVLTAGAAAPAVVAAGGVLGGAFTGAGLLSLQHTVTKKSIVAEECNTKQWLLKTGIGFISGAAIRGAAVGITAGVAGLGSIAMESAAVTTGQYFEIGAGTGAVGGAVSSIASDTGRKIVDGEKVTLKQAVRGAAIGCFVGATVGIAGGAVSKAIVGRQTSAGTANIQAVTGEQIYEAVFPCEQVDPLRANEDTTIKYISEGAWFSRMIVTFSLNGIETTQQVRGSRKFVTIPSRARRIRVKFQVKRPFWGDVMKYDRFKEAWFRPSEPHVFRYDKPTNRTFTISGNLWWEAVMRVSNQYHEETKEL